MTSKIDLIKEVIFNNMKREGIIDMKVLNSTSVVPEGNNFTSDLQRIEVVMESKEGNKTKKNIIVKKIIQEFIQKTPMKEWNLLKTETFMYTVVLPKMNKILDENEPLWPQSLGKGEDLLLLEDLKEQGYEMVRRTEGLDLNHCLMVVRALARFHAMSTKLIIEGGETARRIKDLSVYVFGGRLEGSNEFIRNCISMVNKVTVQKWPKGSEIYIELLKRIEKKGMDKIVTRCMDRDAKLKVLNHGDSWLNNMLFSYDDTKHPISLRLVDYQISNYSSYALDINYFYSTSLNSEVRKNHVSELTKEYHVALSKELNRFGLSGICPKLEEVEREIKDFSALRIMGAITILPLALCKEEAIIKKESFGEITQELKQKIVQLRYSSDAYSSSLLEVLKTIDQDENIETLIDFS